MIKENLNIKMVVAVTFIAVFFIQLWSSKPLIYSQEVTNEAAGIVDENSRTSGYSDYYNREYKKGDQWSFFVEFFRCRPNAIDSFYLDITIEDEVYQGDSSFYVISYWPSKPIQQENFVSEDFGNGSSKELAEREYLYQNFNSAEVYGVMSVIEKATNRNRYRMLYKMEMDTIQPLIEVSIRDSHFFTYRRNVNGPERILPLFYIPFENAKDTCMGSISKDFYQTLPKDFVLNSPSDTMSFCFDEYIQNDTTILELKTKSDFTSRPYWYRHKTYWTDKTKWWSKYELHLNDTGGPPSFGQGLYLKCTLIEEKLAISYQE